MTCGGGPWLPIERPPGARADVLARSALFSPCGRYRYRLSRYWDPAVKPITFLLLNPSTATAEENDPTVERCQRRAFEYGAGGVEIVNLFAWRATDPAAMLAAEDPVGPDNDLAIIEAADLASKVVCAWGNHGAHRGRGDHVKSMLMADPRIRLFHLGITGAGQPRHPLYVGYQRRPAPWEARCKLDRT